jgi:hypothetical protein
VLDVIQLFVPFCKQLPIDFLRLLDLSDLFGNLSLLDVHDLLVFLRNKMLFSFVLLKILFSLSKLLLYRLKCLQLFLLNIKPLVLSVLDHSFEIPLLFMELLAVIILLGIDLMELIEFELVVRIVVVELLLESIWAVVLCVVALWSFLFAHQQSI